MIRKRRLPWCLMLLVLGCRPAPNPSKSTEELLQLMNQRLAVMHDVARWKWNEKRAIADPDREEALLAEMEGAARRQGSDPAFVRRFFVAQLEAAKLLQEDDHARWRSAGQGRFDGVADLTGELRPRIDKLNRQLLAELAKYRPAPPGDVEHLAASILSRIPDQVRQRAIEPLLSAPPLAAGSKPD